MPPAARRQIPAWLMSFLLHFSVLTTCAYFIKDTPRGIAGVEDGKEAGIVLVSSGRGKPEYFANEGGGGTLTTGDNSASAPASAGSPFPESVELPKTNGPKLPSAPGFGGSGAFPGELTPGAAKFALPGKGLPLGKGRGSQARTAVFGVQGEGNRFVYVFDRSGSMEGAPLAAAKQQLIDSLESLDKVHQFQIIFYNQQPRLMQLTPGQQPSMEFAGDAGKKKAESFIGSILADGGTRHMEALEMALRLKPDVIFFLTDADDPKLSSTELDRIRRLNSGTSINAIEFGSGSASGGPNFLKSLAEQNHGNYGYVDISKF
ncbi:MAG: vWA domain-containing protein [Pirellulaceae bacterium]